MKIITPFIEHLLYAMSYTCVCSCVSGDNLRKHSTDEETGQEQAWDCPEL